MATEKATAAVDALYHYRDHYFETFGLDKGAERSNDIKEQINKTLQILDGLKDEISYKAGYFMLRGKALNVLNNFDPQAQDCLSKAVKLDPTLVEAWNQLGDSYFKQEDISNAKNCFTGALNHSRNKVSLRNLSMVMRQLPGSASERGQMIKESVDQAKEAVQLDISDGTSWLILGNAYLSLFFASGQNPATLKQCLSAYSQAEKDQVAKNNPDLHYNRSVAYKFQEDYQSSLDGFQLSHRLDPEWENPKIMKKQMTTLLNDIVELTERKGKLKPKKIQCLLQSISDNDLGPYSGGQYTSSSGQSIKLEKVHFSQIDVETNNEKVVVGKVVCSITTEDPVPFAFCMVDEEETCLSVTVYNLAQGCGVKIGDSVAIPEPFVQKVDVDFEDKKFKFLSIRVDSPVVMVVNGKKLGKDKQSSVQLNVSTLKE